METTFLHAVNEIEYLNSHVNYMFSNNNSILINTC